MKQILDNYKTVDQKIELIAKQLLEKKMAVSKVYDDFDSLFEANKETYQFLTTIVYAGEIALKQAEEKLNLMKQDFNVDPQDIRDFSDNINRFCNRLAD